MQQVFLSCFITEVWLLRPVRLKSWDFLRFNIWNAGQFRLHHPRLSCGSNPHRFSSTWMFKFGTARFGMQLIGWCQACWENERLIRSSERGSVLPPSDASGVVLHVGHPLVREKCKVALRYGYLGCTTTPTGQKTWYITWPTIDFIHRNIPRYNGFAGWSKRHIWSFGWKKNVSRRKASRFGSTTSQQFQADGSLYISLESDQKGSRG